MGVACMVQHFIISNGGELNLELYGGGREYRGVFWRDIHSRGRRRSRGTVGGVKWLVLGLSLRLHSTGLICRYAVFGVFTSLNTQRPACVSCNSVIGLPAVYAN